jgi:hypothetical protein
MAGRHGEFKPPPLSWCLAGNELENRQREKNENESNALIRN